MRTLKLVYRTLFILSICIIALSIFSMRFLSSGYASNSDIGYGIELAIGFLLLIIATIIGTIEMVLNKVKEKKINTNDGYVLSKKSNPMMNISVVVITIAVVFLLVVFLLFHL